MSSFDWKQTIKINIIKLKLVGLWPQNDETYKLNLYTIWAGISFICIISAHNLFQAISIIFILNDLQAVTSAIYLNLSEILGILKAYYLLLNMPILKQLMVTLRSDMFQPKNPRQIILIQSNLKSWKLMYVLYWGMSGGAIFLWISIPILTNQVKNYQLPFMAWYPFINIKTSPTYELIYLYQVIGVLFVGTATLGVDTLIAALTMYIGAQLDLLCDNLRNLSGQKFNKNLIECIKHHKAIIKFSENSNIFFNWIIFFQFFISTTSIGITMFQMTVVDPFSNEFISVLSFELAIIVEIFMYCWFANEIKEKCEKIPAAVFQSDWTGASLQAKKNMVFFMLNCKKPIRISALNLFDLSLDTFMKILRASWSYFTLLQQINTRK